MPENNEVLSEVYFYNSRNGDRKYNADSMTEWLLPFFTSGVFNGGLQVTANGNMTVTIQPGYVNIGGKTRRFKTPTTLDLEVASGTLKRIDNIIVRRDDVARDIYLIAQTGGLAANPVPPKIIRENGVQDYKLAEVFITNGTISITQTNITDFRMDKSVCGWVTATVTEMDFTQIQAQFNAFFAEYKPRIENEYNTYVQNITEYRDRFKNDIAVSYSDYEAFVALYKQYIAAQYQAFMDYLAGYKTDSADAYNALLAWFNSFKITSIAEINALIDTIKGILGQDEAGQLLLMIQELQARQPTAAIGEILHGLDHYPQCTLYHTSHAYGMGGYGRGGYGGGKLKTVPAEYELDKTSVAVKTIPEFAQHTNIHKVCPCKYGFSSTDAGNADSLLLILR